MTLAQRLSFNIQGCVYVVYKKFTRPTRLVLRTFKVRNYYKKITNFIDSKLYHFYNNQLFITNKIIVTIDYASTRNRLKLQLDGVFK